MQQLSGSSVSITSVTWYFSPDSCNRSGHVGPSGSSAGGDGISQDVPSSFHGEGTWRRCYCSRCGSHVIHGHIWGAQHGGCATSEDKNHGQHNWCTTIKRFVTTLRAIRNLLGDTLVSFPDLIWCIYLSPHEILRVIGAGVGFGSGIETMWYPNVWPIPGLHSTYAQKFVIAIKVLNLNTHSH